MQPGEYIVGVECQRDEDMPLAKLVLGELVRTYPGYSWLVVIQGGVIHVRISDWADNWGMAIHQSRVGADWPAFARHACRAAGEFLERANMRRGRATGEIAQTIEGVPDKAMARARLAGALDAGL